MPAFFPDLRSVKKLAEAMAKYQEPENLYKGIIPKNEDELPEARKQLAKYMRDIWNDDIAAAEIEMAVTEENYHEKFREYMIKKYGGKMIFT